MRGAAHSHATAPLAVRSSAAVAAVVRSASIAQRAHAQEWVAACCPRVAQPKGVAGRWARLSPLGVARTCSRRRTCPQAVAPRARHPCADVRASRAGCVLRWCLLRRSAIAHSCDPMCAPYSDRDPPRYTQIFLVALTKHSGVKHATASRRPRMHAQYAR